MGKSNWEDPSVPAIDLKLFTQRLGEIERMYIASEQTVAKLREQSDATRFQRQRAQAEENFEEEVANLQKGTAAYKEAYEKRKKQLADIAADEQRANAQIYEQAAKLEIENDNKRSLSNKIRANEQKRQLNKEKQQKLANLATVHAEAIKNLQGLSDGALAEEKARLQAKLELSKADPKNPKLSEEEKSQLAALRVMEAQAAALKEQEALENLIAKQKDMEVGAYLTYLSGKEQEEIINERLKSIAEEEAQIRAEMATYEAEEKDKGTPESSAEYQKTMDEFQERLKKCGDRVDSFSAVMTKAKTQSLIDDKKKANAAKKEANDAKRAALKTDDYKDALKDEVALDREGAALDAKENAIKAAEEDQQKLKDGTMAMEAAGKALNALTAAIDGNIQSMYEHQGYLNARLQGITDNDNAGWKAIMKTTTNIGMSGIVTQKEVVAKIKEAVDSGIAYNVELRAFLASTAENIASTFNAFDSNLLRLIRIQQNDTTTARLGMEATLLRMLNSTFKDNSYLQDAADTVAGAILDASSQLSKEQSLEFEYIVQKWLGALYSLGLSQEAVSTIAEGINYLGTGNVEALNSNDSLQTLMAMSASKGGIDYADILTAGLNPQKTNDLLKSMVEYLQSIARNTDNNQVTKQAFTNLFGISMSDLKAISNITAQEITELHSNVLSYTDAQNETTNQLNKIMSRMHISKLIENSFDNIMTTTATLIGSTGITYGLWKTLNVIEDLTGGIALPFVNVMGFGVDPHATVTGLGKLGMVGLGLIGSVANGIIQAFNGGATNLSKWGTIDGAIVRGSTLSNIKSGFTEGTSASVDLIGTGSASGEDVKSTSLADASKDAEKDGKIINASLEGKGTTELQKILDAVWKDENTTVISTLQGIRARLDSPFSILTSGGGTSANNSGSLIGSNTSTSGAVGSYNSGNGTNIGGASQGTSTTIVNTNNGGSNGGGNGNNTSTNVTLAGTSNGSLGYTLTELAATLQGIQYQIAPLDAQDIQNLVSSSIFKVEVLSVSSTSEPSSSIITTSPSASEPSSSIISTSPSPSASNGQISTNIQNQGNSNAATNQQIVQTITQLGNQVTTNSSIQNSGTGASSVMVSIDKASMGFSDDLRNQIANGVLNALTAHFGNIESEMQDMIKNMIILALNEGAPIRSQIVNDYMDAFLQKQAFVN